MPLIRSSHSHILEAARVAIYLVLMWSAATWAQRSDAVKQFDVYAPRQTEAAIKALSPQSQVVLSRLAKLKSFPLTRWKYHKGDVEQGAGTDDSSWQEIGVPYSTGTNDTVWVRKTIEVPKSLDGYDLTGARIWIDFGGDDKLTFFLDGRRVAEGENLEPILLFDSAKPGDQARVAYKMWDMHADERFDPDDVKEVPEIRATVGFASNRPDPVDLYTEFVTAALMVPVLSKDVSADRGLLENAIGTVDLQALQSGDGQKFDQSLRHAQQELESLKPLLQTATFHMTGNSHIDAAWLWPWTETVDVVRRTFGTAVQLMSEYPSYTYTQSAAQYNEWIADRYPDINSQIKQRVAEGRWELVGGMWVEPDLNMPDGESLVRQLLIGKRTFRQLYGADVRIGWNPDSFGYDWQLPQIYKKSGIDYFVTQKLGSNETNPLPFKLFWWESPDGSKVLSYLPHHYDNRDLSPIRLANDFLKSRSLAPGLPEFMDLYGVGDHGGGPTRTLLDQGVHWTADKVVPKMTFGTAQAFFSNVETRFSPDSPTWNYALLAQGARPLATPPYGEISIPTWKDELYFEHHRGTYTTQANQKRHMRESEEWLLNAEKYSSLAWIGGQTYPSVDLTEAWKKALFNQFHDLAAGSGLGVIYKDAEKDYDQVRWATEEVSTTALRSIDSRIDTEGLGEPIVLWNPLGWNRGGVFSVNVQMPKAAPGGISILDANNHVLPSEIVSSDPRANTYRLLVKAKDVPSLGYTVLRVVPGKKPFSSDLHINGWTMENSYLKLTVDPHTGCITSLYNKRANFESLAPDACGNQLQTFQDKPQSDDAWNIDPGTLDHPVPITQANSVEFVDKGPLRGVIRITRKWQGSTFVQEIILDTDSDEVEIANDIDWHETHVLLKAAFPLAAGSKAATYEIPYGTIERPTTRDNTWEQAKFEVPALRWADLGDGKHGFSLINESKYGYDCQGSLLRLSLLRSPIWPDPNADRGHHHFGYALYPHRGDWKSALTVRHGYEYNYKLNALQLQSHTGLLPSTHSFARVEPQNLVLTAMKKAEGSDALILRFYEWAGVPTSATLYVPSGAASATLTNLMEHPEGQTLEIKSSDQITVPAKPYSIVSVEVNYAHAPQGN